MQSLFQTGVSRWENSSRQRNLSSLYAFFLFRSDCQSQSDSLVMDLACFRCSECKSQLKAGNYASMDGKIWCKPHFKQIFLSKVESIVSFPGSTRLFVTQHHSIFEYHRAIILKDLVRKNRRKSGLTASWTRKKLCPVPAIRPPQSNCRKLLNRIVKNQTLQYWCRRPIQKLKNHSSPPHTAMRRLFRELFDKENRKERRDLTWIYFWYLIMIMIIMMIVSRFGQNSRGQSLAHVPWLPCYPPKQYHRLNSAVHIWKYQWIPSCHACLW